MIKLAGTASLAFDFPAPLNVAYAYYSELETVLHYLPHINVVDSFGPDHFRLLYASREFGGYSMKIYCDLRASIEGGLHVIRIVPEENVPPVDVSAGVNSSVGRGYFSSRGLFFENGEETRIEYEFELRSQLPRPLGMRLMPSRVVNGIARNVTRTRMREIAEGFIDRSLTEFPCWLAEREEASGDDR